MRAAVALLVGTACGHYGFGGGGDGGSGASDTSLKLSISAAAGVTVQTLDVRLAFASLDPGALNAVPARGGVPPLPGDVVLALPHASGSLTATLDAVDSLGRTLTATATADITAGDQQTGSAVIGGELTAMCRDGVTDGGETAVDCGGPCPGCPIGTACFVANDCANGGCVNGFCEAVSGPPVWQAIPDMPVARIGLAAVLGHDDRIYVFGGGVTDAALTNEVDVYDPSRQLWGSAPVLPTPRGRIAGAIDGSGTIYAIGGINSGDSPLAIVESYAPGDAAWKTAPSLPAACGYLPATRDASGTVWTYGGSPCDTTNDSLAGAAWSAHAALPATRTNLGAACGADDRLYAIGGHVTADEYSKTAVAYTTATDTWMTLPAMTNGRSDLGAVAAPDGRVYAIGGYQGTDGVAFVEAIRPTGGWVPVASLSTGRDSGAATLGPDGRIYSFGGRYMVTPGQSSAEVYGPALQLASALGAAGSTVTVTGTNFAASANVVIYFDDVPVERATTDLGGALPTLQVVVPSSLASGGHVVRAIDDRAAYPVMLPFTVP